MPQNRKKLIDLFIGNLSNVIIHEVLIISAESKEISSYYKKERDNAITVSKKYREKINPKEFLLRNKDAEYIKTKIINKVKSELNQRVLKGYKNINLELVETLIEQYSKNLKIIE